MSTNRLVVAGTGSGVGKTTVTIGLMAAFTNRGLTVQGFKCGPDYIDPTYHTAVTGRISRNLDSWMLPNEVVNDIFVRAATGADLAIIEGVMGFYDGKDPRSNVGSTAEICLITDSPVVLIVNCASMARSAAAIVKGFQLLEPKVKIVAVIANRVGSEGHYQLVKTAIEQECNIPVVGYLKKENGVEIPERHLGLIPSVERGELQPFFAELGRLVEATVDLDLLYKLTQTSKLEGCITTIFTPVQKRSLRIAVAKDAAFNFYYQENLELLEAKGAELVFFSPLKGEPLPNNIHGLYIGGGFPEEFAAELACLVDVKATIKSAIQNGLPTLAECGGFMYLTDSLITTSGETFSMVGAIPGQVTMQTKLAALGYREISGNEGNFLLSPKLIAKGHEFHYSTFASSKVYKHAYEVKGMRWTKPEGYMNDHLIAGYCHFHFASCPEMVDNWLRKCEEWKLHGCTKG